MVTIAYPRAKKPAKNKTMPTSYTLAVYQSVGSPFLTSKKVSIFQIQSLQKIKIAPRIISSIPNPAKSNASIAPRFLSATTMFRFTLANNDTSGGDAIHHMDLIIE